MPNQFTAEIEARINKFVAELNTLVRQAALESVSAALGTNGAAAPRRGPGRARQAASDAPTIAALPTALRLQKRKKGAKRDPRELAKIADAVKAHVTEHRGEGVEAIAKHLGVPTSELKLPIAKLLGAKAIKKRGAKRATRYFPG